MNFVRMAWNVVFTVTGAAENRRRQNKKVTHPINKPKGIDTELVSDNGKAADPVHDDLSAPGRKDIRPEDVFPGTPNQVGVNSLYQTGKDLDKALETKIPKDKGYDAVKQLSQYLIETKDEK